MSGTGAGLVAAVGRAYRDPRGEMARQIAGGLSEPRALAHLAVACGLGFVASLPRAVRTAQGLDAPDALAGVISAHLFGYLFVAPLFLYGLAAVVHLAARAFGGRGTFIDARAATFWALLLAGPIALALALAGVAAEAAGVLPWLGLVVYAGAAFWLWLAAATIAEAERFARTGGVAAVMAIAFAAVAVGLGTLPHAPPATG